MITFARLTSGERAAAAAAPQQRGREGSCGSEGERAAAAAKVEGQPRQGESLGGGQS